MAAELTITSTERRTMGWMGVGASARINTKWEGKGESERKLEVVEIPRLGELGETGGDVLAGGVADHGVRHHAPAAPQLGHRPLEQQPGGVGDPAVEHRCHKAETEAAPREHAR